METRNIEDISLRDYVTLEEIEMIEYVQNKNTTLLELGMSYDERKKALINLLEKRKRFENKLESRNKNKM